MPRTRQCTFCGSEFPPGTGMLFVRNDGTAYWFCSRKCRKSQLHFKRDARKLKWTQRYGQAQRQR